MSHVTRNEFWRQHLVGVENPLVHFVPTNWLDLGTLKRASSELRFRLFLVDAQHTQSVSALMDAFAGAMNFPNSFGRNWDALADLTRDLSWNSARGYVLILSNADSLLRLANEGFSALLGVLEATVREWRDEHGEYGERKATIPFHVIFSGSAALRAMLEEKSKEPLCDHEAELSVHIVRNPGGVGATECFRDAERLTQAGADLDLVLSFLRERGQGEVDSIYVLASLMGKSIPETKAFVDNSQTWSDRYETDARIREAARDALRDLGFL
jgi:RNAse (barnase) inhibitor barstar